MSRDPFSERRMALEEEYFHKKDAQLVDKLKAVFHKQIGRDALRQETGITNDQVLDNLVALNLSGESLPAFQLFPLLEVAWADNIVDQREIESVLASAEQHGIPKGSAAYGMLENGLKTRPGEDSRKAWYMYATELRSVLTPDELKIFRDDLLEYATRVATTSGGLFHVAFTVSPNEKKVLAAIEKALTPD